MQCVSHKSKRKTKKLLNREKVNQLGIHRPTGILLVPARITEYRLKDEELEMVYLHWKNTKRLGVIN